MERVKFELVVAMALLLLGFPLGGSAETARALFVFGDSYADTGNHDASNSSNNEGWRRPYGFNWPGFPAGRLSSGKIQTDRLAEVLGLPTPIPYERLRTHHCEEIPKKIVHGVNFAVGGSGIFPDYGYITVPDQVKQFKWLIKETSAFSGHELARSVVLLSVAGVDYFAYLDNNNNNVTGLESVVAPVVGGIAELVRDLYDHGLRNFVVSSVVALGCLPDIGRTSCNATYDKVIELHTRLLDESMQQLRDSLTGSSIIILDLPYVYPYIFSNPSKYGFEGLIFSPCCRIKGEVKGCAEQDERGMALFEMCEDPNKMFFWDWKHPTHIGWYVVMSLYMYGDVYEGKELSFVTGASNLKEWVKSLGLDAHDISPAKRVGNLPQQE